MKKIKAYFLYLMEKRTITYTAVLIIIWWIISYSLTINYINRQIKIKELDSKKQTFIDSKQKELEPLVKKELEFEKELTNLKTKIAPIQECITNVKSTFWTEDIHYCKKPWLIESADADEIEKVILAPTDLFYTTAIRDKCYVSQTEKEHFKSNWRLATDVACWFKSMLFAPDYNNQVKEYIYDIKTFPDTWNTLILHFEDKWTKFFWLIWHIKSSKFDWPIKTWQVIWEMDLSWVSTGYHSHIELWQWTDLDNAVKVSYSSSTKALMNFRQWKLDITVKIWDPIYFTSYNIWDINQNDSSPNIWASGVDLRTVKNPIALTADIRKLYWIKFWDKIKMHWPCSWIYEVHDEKNQRYRYSCIKEQWVCNKWDIAIPLNSKDMKCSWIYTISKI